MRPIVFPNHFRNPLGHDPIFQTAPVGSTDPFGNIKLPPWVPQTHSGISDRSRGFHRPVREYQTASVGSTDVVRNIKTASCGFHRPIREYQDCSRGFHGPVVREYQTTSCGFHRPILENTNPVMTGVSARCRYPIGSFLGKVSRTG
jgi:hypothetical protein